MWLMAEGSEVILQKVWGHTGQILREQGAEEGGTVRAREDGCACS